MAEHSRIEDLRRRVQREPASIAFAQLAEEYRRAGQLDASVETCRAGLALHPGYLSARVTLGRALLELGQVDEAQHELETVLKSAPENLAAIRGVAEILHKRGELPQALAQYRAALALARNDPDLEQTVEDLTRQVAPAPRPGTRDGLSLDDMQQALDVHPPAPGPRLAVGRHETPSPAAGLELPAARPAPALPAPAPAVVPRAPEGGGPAPAAVPRSSDAGPASQEVAAASAPTPAPAPPSPAVLSPAPVVELTASSPHDRERQLAERRIAALTAFLAAIHAVRAERRA